VDRTRAQRIGAVLVVAAGLAAGGAWFVRHRRGSTPEVASLSPFTGAWLGCKRLEGNRCARDAGRPLRLFVGFEHGALQTLTRSDGAQAGVRALGHVSDRDVYAIEGEPRGPVVLAFADGTRMATALEDELTTPAIVAVDERKKKGLFELAIAEADASLVTARGREALRLLSLSARAALAGGAPAEAVKRLERAELLAREERFEDDEATERLVRAYVQSTRLGSLTEAREALGDATGFWSHRPQHAAHRLYYRGLASMLAGDARQAITDLRAAIEGHALLGNSSAELDATAALAGAFAHVGRVDEAVALVERTSRETPALQSCNGVFFANNATFAALRSAEHHTVAWRANDELRARAMTSAAQWIAFSRKVLGAACGDRAARTLTEVHDAELARLGDDTLSLARAVRAARDKPALMLPVVALDWLELDLDLAVRAGRSRDAERLASELLHEATALDQPHSAWAAHVARARLHRTRKPDEARAALEAAEAVLDRTLRDVAVGDGRNAFLTAHELSAAMLFDALLDAHAFDDAEAIANRSARRALESATSAYAHRGPKSPEQERALRNYLAVKVRVEEAAAHDWELPASEVGAARSGRARALGDARRELEAAFARNEGTTAKREAPKALVPGKLRLVLHPTPGGYALLVRGGGPDRVFRVNRRIASEARESVARELLEAALAGAREGSEVHLTAYGPLRRLDWPRLAVDRTGTPLATRFAFVEHLGLNGIEEPARSEASFVIADATSDLPYAAREGDYVRERVGAQAIGGTEATRLRVQEALESGTFLHYAGHGRFAGADGFESELLLAGGSTLAVSDVLLLARTPAIAVLSGCELAKSDDASGESFGIAQALLARGTHFAIAPSRTVKDELAERFVRALYSDGALTERTVAVRMHEALAQLSREVPGEDWSTFRLLAR
jgi:cellulose synthase operon protein C